jgi:hypothetical protein
MPPIPPNVIFQASHYEISWGNTELGGYRMGIGYPLVFSACPWDFGYYLRAILEKGIRQYCAGNEKK